MATNCIGWIEPLDLECLLVNNLAGSADIFAVLSIMFIAGLGAYFRMLNGTLFIMIAIYSMLMMKFFTGTFLLIVLIGGLVGAYGILKLIKS